MMKYFQTPDETLEFRPSTEYTPLSNLAGHTMVALFKYAINTENIAYGKVVTGDGDVAARENTTVTLIMVPNAHCHSNWIKVYREDGEEMVEIPLTPDENDPEKFTFVMPRQK